MVRFQCATDAGSASPQLAPPASYPLTNHLSWLRTLQLATAASGGAQVCTSVPQHQLVSIFIKAPSSTQPALKLLARRPNRGLIPQGRPTRFLGRP
jgi:hypothetical protein